MQAVLFMVVHMMFENTLFMSKYNGGSGLTFQTKGQALVAFHIEIKHIELC